VQKCAAVIILPSRGEFEEGGVRLRLQQVIHILTSKSTRPLFKPILRSGRLSLLLREAEASSVREREVILE